MEKNEHEEEEEEKVIRIIDNIVTGQDNEQRSSSSTILNEYTINNRYYTTYSYKYEIKRKDVKFLTKLALITCVLFPFTGIPSIVLTQKMKYHYYKSNYDKAIRYKQIAQIFTYMNILFAILSFFTIMICLKLV